MLRTLKTVMRQDREKFKIPKSIQQAIPIQRIWPDWGISVWDKIFQDLPVFRYQLCHRKQRG